MFRRYGSRWYRVFDLIDEFGVGLSRSISPCRECRLASLNRRKTAVLATVVPSMLVCLLYSVIHIWLMLCSVQLQWLQNLGIFSRDYELR